MAFLTALLLCVPKGESGKDKTTLRFVMRRDVLKIEMLQGCNSNNSPHAHANISAYARCRGLYWEANRKEQDNRALAEEATSFNVPHQRVIAESAVSIYRRELAR